MLVESEKTVVSGNKFVSSNCEKYDVLWDGKICWTNMCF